MKKISILAAATILMGIGTGIGSAVVQVNMWPWSEDPAIKSDSSDGASDSSLADGQPQVHLEEAIHHFGVMHSNATGRHEFIFTNQGTAPLTLSEGESSCSCTVIMMEETEVKPGESTPVALEWKGAGYTGHFEKTATIFTNDPNRSQLTLTISGRITTSVKAIPSDLVFSRITAGEESTQSLLILGYLKDHPIEILGHEFSDPKTAEHFEVTFTALSTDQVKEEDSEALHGYSVDVTAKTGLPLGTFRQSIRVKTNLEDAPVFEIPIKGTITSEISVIGRGWKQEEGILFLGSIDRSKGTERQLRIIVRGPHRKEVKFQTETVFPDLLKVTLAEPTLLPVRDSEVVQVNLTVRVPPGAQPVSHLGSVDKLGRIEIRTTHPKVPKLLIYVRFAIPG